MDYIGLTITIVSVVALLAGIIWLVFIRSGKPKFKFEKQQAYGDFLGTIKSDHKELFQYYDINVIAKSAMAVYKACLNHLSDVLETSNIPTQFTSKNLIDIRQKLAFVEVWLRSEDEYMKKARVIPGHPSIAVFDQYQDKIYNSWIPFATINDDRARNVSFANLLIHEWIHGVSLWAWGGEDPTHKNEFLWEILESEAIELYKDIK